MKKQMERTVYEAPVTERFQVELETGFMAGSAEIENPKTDDNRQGEIFEQEVNTGFDNTIFTNDGWN